MISFYTPGEFLSIGIVNFLLNLTIIGPIKFFFWTIWWLFKLMLLPITAAIDLFRWIWTEKKKKGLALALIPVMALVVYGIYIVAPYVLDGAGEIICSIFGK